ncbi:MAG: penicillin-binding transpeptidase domain-containing protein, partial [Eubacterium sp.]
SVSRGEDYINRAISPYAVGSVFKLVVCACALENNIKPLYRCTSSITVGDTTFHCQTNNPHGLQGIKDALANSCNCYFVNLALKIGKDKLLDTAQKLGFGKTFELYSNWIINSGTFPDSTDLASSGQLALVGFGQGKLTDSPMHFASVVSCLANGGYYNPPTLDFVDGSEKPLIDSKVCDKILEYMRYVVTNGTAAAAEYKNSSAGKTATAQSGIYIDGREVLITWFAGVYPYDEPKYTIVVMQEDGASGAGDCCPVFRTIVENLDKL